MAEKTQEDFDRLAEELSKWKEPEETKSVSAEKPSATELYTILDECFESVIAPLGAGYEITPSRANNDLANRVFKILQRFSPQRITNLTDNKL